ncbi:MAG: redoxin family protein [Anaerolineales bacterium]|nr:redoxin family protein [Anaerolineales bacterium]
MESLLQPRLVRMPEFAPGEWLNTPHPLTRTQLRGQIILVDFWDYACVNCLRTLPYLAQWQQRYAEKGLTIIGIHTPEFQFAQIATFVATAVATHHIHYPILLDNQQQNWERYANKAWPTKYLIDQDGYIRLQRQGEGYYQETELAIQTLLRQRDPQVTLPEILPPLRAEDTPGAVCYRPTPELYAGYQGGGLFGGALGNPEGYLPHNPMFYTLPPNEERQAGQFYVDGAWYAWPEALAYAGQTGGRILLPYQAASLNAVLSPTADPVEMRLGLRPSQAEPVIVVKQNGRFLDNLHAGADITFTPQGESIVRVSEPRMYQLIQNPTYAWHELELTFQATGLALYAFTFSTCIAPAAAPNEPNTIQIK